MHQPREVAGCLCSRIQRSRHMGKNWKISAQINQAGTSVSAGSVVYDATVTGDGCTALTPTFTNIGKTN